MFRTFAITKSKRCLGRSVFQKELEKFWCSQLPNHTTTLQAHSFHVSAQRNMTDIPDSTLSTPQESRSWAEISKLIKRRVEERDAWKGPPHLSLRAVAGLFWTHRSQFLFPKLPSQEELDRDFPVQPLDWDQLRSNAKSKKLHVTWLGHASLLVQMGGFTLVTDPVFSERCAPLQFAGPKRYRPPPCTLSELTDQLSIDALLISHNHYDHLDYNSVCHLAKNCPSLQIILPLGLQKWFSRYVLPRNSQHIVHELDWHETTNLFQEGDSPGLQVTAVPMKHWSNRVGDRDETLWCGYSIQTKPSNSKPLRFLFPGDTAWFDGLEEIGRDYGPFDLAAIPIGAYEPNEFMRIHHINVEEAVRMKKAIQAEKAVPIHWGTFPLTIEPVMEPRERLMELMGPNDDSFRPWLIGETVESE